MNCEGIDLSLAACAQELKTPLVLMRQLSLELEQTTERERQIEICRQMRLTAERSLRLADNLTKIVRLEDALFELEPVQLVGLCQEAVDELTPLARSKAQRIIINRTKRALVCVSNRALLKSLLIGLLDNALFSSRAHSEVLVTTRISRGNIELAVRDNGPIIDLAQYRKLKSALGRQSLPVSARPLSSGLGIAIAQKFIDVMHGELAVARHHTGGVTFRARLPISRQLSILEI
jgi:K+-sensing histidine kinase KdpD